MQGLFFSSVIGCVEKQHNHRPINNHLSLTNKMRLRHCIKQACDLRIFLQNSLCLKIVLKEEK